MLLPQGISSYGFKFDNWGANPSATPGTSVTPGASDAEGASWTQIASAANIAADVYWVLIIVCNGNTAGAIKDHLLDIGVDPAGGTSYAAVISNIVCGQSAGFSTGAPLRQYLFPMFIKSGSTVAARVQGSNATAGSIRIVAKFFGQPSAPEAVPVGQFSETIGTITGSAGVSFTPGNAADGTWVSLGTTAKAMWWWQLCYGISNGTITAEYTYYELAYGDATNKISIMRQMSLGSTSEITADRMGANVNFAECFCPVPAGSELFVRGRCSDAPDTGYHAVAVGVGG